MSTGLVLPGPHSQVKAPLEEPEPEPVVATAATLGFRATVLLWISLFTPESFIVAVMMPPVLTSTSLTYLPLMSALAATPASVLEAGNTPLVA